MGLETEEKVNRKLVLMWFSLGVQQVGVVKAKHIYSCKEPWEDINFNPVPERAQGTTAETY